MVSFIIITVCFYPHVHADSDVCSLHLINDGVTVDGSTVGVEWQGTGPSHVNVPFFCVLDGGNRQECKYDKPLY